MANDVSADDIAGYAAYLKSQGHSDSDIHGYTKYLADQHGVDHPSKIGGNEQKSEKPSLLDTELPLGITPRGSIQGALDALPTAGMIGGGVVGTLIEPGIGSLGGAGVGAAGGQTLKNIGEKYILGKEQTMADALTSPFKAAAEGVASEMGGQAVGKGVEMAAGTKAGKAVLSAAGSGASRVGEMFTGVPAKEIETYAKHGPEIDRLVTESENNIQDMADTTRKQINTKIAEYKQSQNDIISKTLKDPEKNKVVNAKPIIDAIENYKARLDPKLYHEDIANIDELLSRVKNKAPLNEDTGEHLVNSTDIHSLQRYLRTQAESAYGTSPIGFSVGPEGAKAAKDGAAAARGILSKVSPEIAQANTNLSKLHNIEDVMNPNILSEGKTAAPLLAAGSGTNPANEKILKRIGEQIGYDALGDANKIAAARTFGKPAFTPQDTTGKAAARMLAAGAAGFAASGGNPVIAALSAGAVSPASLKVGVNATRAAGQLAGAVPNVIVGKGIELAAGAGATAIANKGRDKWATDGFSNLMKHAGPDDQKMLQDMSDDLMGDNKTKDLLIRASAEKPGSKAMQSILDKIKGGGK